MPTCTCPLTGHPDIGEHPESDHTDERCTGYWTSQPPCGGCINCLLAQWVYYDRAKED